MDLVINLDVIPKYNEWRNPDNTVTKLSCTFLQFSIPICNSGEDGGRAGGIGFYRSPTNWKGMRNFVFHESGKNLENHLRVLCKDRIITGPGKILADRGL